MQFYSCGSILNAEGVVLPHNPKPLTSYIVVGGSSKTAKRWLRVALRHKGIYFIVVNNGH